MPCNFFAYFCVSIELTYFLILKNNCYGMDNENL